MKTKSMCVRLNLPEWLTALSQLGVQSAQLTLSGSKVVASSNRLLTTVAYQLGGKRTYALEGAIFIAGAAVQWLRDGLKVVKKAADTGALAKAADRNQSVYLVPAFVGLGAPYWNAEVLGALFGLTRATTNKELARAALEAVCYQTNDLLEAMKRDWGARGQTILRVDGGMTASDWTMQFLTDILGARRLTVPWCWKQQLEVRPISPACRQACCRSRKFSQKPGSGKGASRRAWTQKPAPRNGRDGKKRSANYWLEIARRGKPRHFLPAVSAPKSRRLKVPNRAEHCSVRERGLPSRGFARNHR